MFARTDVPRDHKEIARRLSEPEYLSWNAFTIASLHDRNSGSYLFCSFPAVQRQTIQIDPVSLSFPVAYIGGLAITVVSEIPSPRFRQRSVSRFEWPRSHRYPRSDPLLMTVFNIADNGKFQGDNQARYHNYVDGKKTIRRFPPERPPHRQTISFLLRKSKG